MHDPQRERCGRLHEASGGFRAKLLLLLVVRQGPSSVRRGRSSCVATHADRLLRGELHSTSRGMDALVVTPPTMCRHPTLFLPDGAALAYSTVEK